MDMQGAPVVRQTIKKVAKQLGVYPHMLAAYKAARRNRIYRGVDDLVFRSRFGSVDKFELSIDGESFVFSTEDDFSKRWFFPRYAGGKLHEPNVTRLLLDELRGARVFADVGALLGYYAVLASKLMPGGQVWAFEMDDYNHGMIARNLELNGARNVRSVHAAVADKPGTLKYRRDSRQTGGVFKLARNRTQLDPSLLHQVDAIALDETFAEGQEPDVVKIDVEGAEILVVRGMLKLLAKKQPTLFLEVHPNTIQGFDATAADLLRIVADHGYQVYQIRTKHQRTVLEPMPKLDVEHNEMLYCIPKNRTPPQPS